MERESFGVHTREFAQPASAHPEPSREAREVVLAMLEQEFDPSQWQLPDDWDSFDSYERVLARLNMQSSPGYPYSSQAPTNGEFLGWDGVECQNRQRVMILWNDVKRLFEEDQVEVILTTFVKEEPHTLKKVGARRWRLIQAAPLHVQVWWQMLFCYGNDAMVRESIKIPAQQGFTIVGGAWKSYLDSWRNKGLKCGLDFSAFDWTVRKWMLDDALRLRLALGRGRRLGDWHRQARKAYHAMYVNPKVLFSDGSLWEQTVPGIQKSGVVNTIADNSVIGRMNYLHAWLVYLAEAEQVDPELFQRPASVHCGDDMLVASKAKLLKPYLSRFGLVVKYLTQSLEFCGHKFRSTGMIPMYWTKHVKMMMHATDVTSSLDAMLRMYAHCTKKWKEWAALADQLGVKRFSVLLYRHWKDRPADWSPAAQTLW